MATGKATTYDLTVGVMLDMEDMFHLLDPFDVPLLGQYGADGRSAIAKDSCFEKKVEWLDDTLLNPRDQLNGAILTADAFITVDNREKFTTGDVVLVNSEYMRVTGYGTTAQTLLVTRGYNSSTAASASDNAVVVGVGTALAEGSDPNDARSVDRSAKYNLTQIFGPHKVEVSGTENVVRKYGLRGTTEFDHQLAARMKEIGVALEQAILYGTRSEDTSNKWRTMGGLTYYITTNVDSSTTAITEDKLIDQIVNCYNAGGSPDRAVVGATQKRKISAFHSATQSTAADRLVRLGRQDSGRGSVVEYLDTDFGRISFILDRWARTSDLFLFNRDQVKLCTLRPTVFEPLSKTGDSIKGQILCEKTLKVYREKHAAKFTALT